MILQAWCLAKLPKSYTGYVYLQILGRKTMAIARITEISAESTKSFEDAVKEGVSRANKTLRNVSGAWVQDQEVTVKKGKITNYRVKLKVTFVLED